jgi:opacity protein-like surface antigen
MIARLVFITSAAVLFVTSAAHAQTATVERPWSAEVSIGWDNSISGNVHAAGIGTIAGLPAVVEQRSYDDVYGTGVQWRFGAGYMLDERQEVRGVLTIQNVSADALRIGTLGTSNLFATIDAGYRYYFPTEAERFRPYAGATIGIAVLDEIDADFAAPDLGLTLNATDFYDGTAAFAFGLEGGVLYELTDRVDLNANLGFRYVSGLSEVDGLQGTGLEGINDDSGRWTLPLMVGVRFKF